MIRLEELMTGTEESKTLEKLLEVLANAAEIACETTAFGALKADDRAVVAIADVMAALLGYPPSL